MSTPSSTTNPGSRDWRESVGWTLVAATILGQILWILVDGQARTSLTIATVFTFAAVTLLQVSQAGGLAAAGIYLLAVAGIGWVAEAVGTSTGLPFGRYEYTDLLGWRLGAVPIVIPFAWAMMALPLYLLVRSLRVRFVPAWALAAISFAAWDLFLDPQMVGEGYWVWQTAQPALPGIPGIPLSNFAGWLLLALLLMRVVALLPSPDALPAQLGVLLSWVYFSNVFAALVFFDRPGVALWGGAAMGLFVVPWWLRLMRGWQR